MLIQQVTLQNIKSYGSPPVIIPFQPGLNLIAGPNGAGKSTILEAIGYVLFDALPYKQNEFIRRGKSGRATIVVRVCSAYDGRVYDIERGIPGPYNVIDVEDRLDIGVSSKDDLLEWLCQHLKIHDSNELKALFQDAVGVQQGTMTAVFLDTPARRKPVFDALLRLQEYEIAWRTLGQTQRYITELITNNEKEIARREGQSERLPALKEQVSVIETAFKSKEEALREAEEKLASVQAALAELDQLKQQIDTLSQQIGQANIRIEQLQGSLATGQEDCRQSTEAAEIVRTNDEAHHRYLAADKRIEELEKLRRQRDKLLAQRQAVRSELDAVNHKLEHIVTELKAVEKAEAQLTALQPLVQQQERLEAARDEVREKQKEKRRLEEQIANDNGKREALNGLIAELQSDVKKREELRRRVEEADRERNELLHEQNQLRTRHNEQKSVLEQAETAFETAERQFQEYTRLQESLQERHASLEKLQVERERITADLAKRQDLDQEILEFERKIRDAEHDRSSAQSVLDHVAQELVELRQNREMLGEEGAICPVCRRTMDHGSHSEAIRFFEDREAALDAQTQRANATIQSADEAIERWRPAKADLEQQRDQLASSAVLQAIDQQIEKIRVDLNALENQTARMTEVLQAHADAKEQRNLAKATLKELQDQIDEQTAALQALAQRTYDLQQEISNLPTPDELERQVGELNNLTASIKAAEARLNELTDIDNEVSRLEQELVNLGNPRQQQAIAKDKASKRQELEEAQQQQQELFSRVESNLQSLDERLSPFEGLDAQLDAAQIERAENADGNRLYVEHIKIAELLEERERNVKRILTQLQEENERRDRWTDEYKQISDGYDGDKHRTLSDEREALTKRQGALSADKHNLEEQLSGIRSEIDQLECVVAEIDGLREREKRLHEEQAASDFVRQSIREAGPRIRRRKVELVSDVAAQYFNEIMRDYTMHLSWDPEDYGISIEQNGETRPFAVLSGGEQMVAALAVRLALLTHMTSAQAIFLDEPTINLDEERRIELAERLSEISGLRGLKQLFIITHDDTFSSNCDHVISVIKENGISCVETDNAAVT